MIDATWTSISAVASIEFSFAVYVGAFTVAAALCFASLSVVRTIDDPDTRLGLATFLAVSGLWAVSHVGYLAAPGVEAKYAFYSAGLVFGFVALLPWLYFCSAYTNRSLHRERSLQWTAVGIFAAVVLVKVTNPLHHLYFTVELVDDPFVHLVVSHGVFHWLAMGFSYIVAGVSLFMLFELFSQISFSTKPIAALVALMGLPVVLNLLGETTDLLLNLTYEPLGVAVFAVMTAFLYFDTFQAIRVAGTHTDPIILLSDDGRIREYNESAADIFEHLGRDAIGKELAEVVPHLGKSLSSTGETIEVATDGGTEYYRIVRSPFMADQRQYGRLLTLNNVTDEKQYEQELEQKNQRLEEFADVLSHDIRNPLQVIKTRLDLLRNRYPETKDDLEPVERSVERIENLSERLLKVARLEEEALQREQVSVEAVAGRAWDNTWTATATLQVDVPPSVTLRADKIRLAELFENLFRNAITHAGEDVTVTVGTTAGGIYVADDGPGIPPDSRGDIFEMGYSTRPDGNGLGLGIVAEIADAHGWHLSVTEGDDGGARFEITGIERLTGRDEA